MTMTGTDHDRSGAAAAPLAPAPATTDAASAAVDLLCLLDRYGAAHGAGDVSIKSSILELSRARRNAVGSGYCGGEHDDYGPPGSPSRSSSVPMTASSFSAFDVREELRARAVLQRCRRQHWAGPAPTAAGGKKHVAIIEEEGGVDDGEPELVSATYSTDGDVTPTKSSAAKEPQLSGPSEKGELSFVLRLDGGARIAAPPKSPRGKEVQPAPAPAPMGSRGDGIMDMGLRRRRNAPGDGNDGGGEGDESKKWTVEEENVEEDGVDEDEEEERLLQTCDPIDLFGALPPPALRAAQRKAREALARYVEAANVVAEMDRLLLISRSGGGGGV